MAEPPDESVGPWTLRNYFNWGGYYERAIQGEFILDQTRKPASEKYRKLFGSETLTVRTEAFEKITRNKIFKTHHFESPNGDMLHRNRLTGVVTPTGQMDPKRVFFAGVLYHLDETLMKEIKYEDESQNA